MKDKLRKITKKFITCTIIFCCIQSVVAQETNFREIDTKTYKFYIENKWDSLILTGKKGIAAGIDYFYLRARMGKAYFEKNNFAEASEQLKKALTFNASDAFCLELLYHAYNNTNDVLEARILEKENPEIFKDITKKAFPNEIFFDFGITRNSQINNEFDIISKANNFIASQSNIDWAEFTNSRSINYIGGGINYFAGKKILITNYFGNLAIDNKKIIQIGPRNLTDQFVLKQNQLYSNALIRISDKTYLTPALHIINVSFNSLFSNFDKNPKKVIQNRSTVTFTDFAASLAFEKKYKYFSYGINGVIAKLNEGRQLQIGGSALIYPFGNLNLYSLTSVNLHKQFNKNNIIFDQKFGFKIMKYMWIDAFATIGKINNYSEENAFVVHNTTDIIKQRIGASVIFPFNNFKLTIKYQNLLKTTDISYHVPDDPEDKFSELSSRDNVLLISLALKINTLKKKLN